MREETENRFYVRALRKLARLWVKPLVFLRITPNQITIFRFLVFTPLTVICYLRGEYLWSLLGLVFLSLNVYFDYVDGQLARESGATTKVGDWLDRQSDLISRHLVLASVAYGVYQTHSTSFWVAIAILSLVGEIGIHLIILEYEKSIFTSTGFGNGLKSISRMTLLDKIIKEFVILESFPFLFLGALRYPQLIIATICNHLEIFLLVVAIFYNLRWIIMFWAYALALSDKKTSSEVIKLLKKYL